MFIPCVIFLNPRIWFDISVQCKDVGLMECRCRRLGRTDYFWHWHTCEVILVTFLDWLLPTFCPVKMKKKYLLYRITVRFSWDYKITWPSCQEPGISLRKCIIFPFHFTNQNTGKHMSAPYHVHSVTNMGKVLGPLEPS